MLEGFVFLSLTPGVYAHSVRNPIPELEILKIKKDNSIVKDYIKLI